MKPAYLGDIDIVEGWEDPFSRVYFYNSQHEMGYFSAQDPIVITHVVAEEKPLHERCWTLAEKLCKEHPGISTYRGIFGGIPHIRGVRLSVADVLSHLYVLGSIDALLERYGQDVSEAQIKEAIAYAQDFLEAAFHEGS
jgi:uncharacterized protein (DUF433 family)